MPLGLPGASDPAKDATEFPMSEEPTPPGPTPVEPIRLNYVRDGVVPPGADLVTVATFEDSWEAHLAIGTLEAAGIAAALADENIVSMGGGLYTNMTGGVKLQVPRMEVERGLAALPKRVRARVVACQRCRSTEARQVDFGPGVKIAFLLMLGIPYLFVEKPWYCLGCGNAWRASAAPAQEDEDEDDEVDDEDEDGQGGDEPAEEAADRRR
jgi:hypothetical protein